MLDEREPDWKALNLKDEKKSGEDVLDRTHQYVDKDFMDEIAESASRHTPTPPSKSATLTNRIAEKEAAEPRVNAVKADWRKGARRDEADYKNSYGDNDSLMDEVSMSLESAEKEGTVDKKEWTDAQVQTYVKGLLNQGDSPSKVAAKLEKLAELELFNHQMATDYLQRNAGMLGLAYLEPNTFMDKQNPNYRHNASADSKDCVRAHEAMKQAGVKPQAHSVKQITACSDCQFFKKDAAGKRCNLYHLPVVATANELSQIVNHLTPGVPNNKKRAALVEIANRTDRQVQNTKVAEQSNLVKTADAHQDNQDKRSRTSAKPKFFSEHVAKLHSKGVSLQAAYKWASVKFGSVEVSIAFRGFVQSLRKNAKGRVVVASSDLKFLNSIGIRSESFEGSAKCASCPTHFGIEAKVENERGALRVDGKFAQRTASAAHTLSDDTQNQGLVLTAAKVRTLHQKGHSLEKIFKGAASKVGSVEAKKRIAEYILSLKKTPGRISVNASDRSFLEGKLGFKAAALRTLDEVRPPADRVVASSGGSPILAYPGMEKQAAEHKPTDGHSILNEYDLSVSHDQPLDINEPERLDVEGHATAQFDLE